MRLLRRCLVESSRGSESKDDRLPTGGLSFWLLERTGRIVARFVASSLTVAANIILTTSADYYCPLPMFMVAKQLVIKPNDIKNKNRIVARFLRATASSLATTSMNSQAMAQRACFIDTITIIAPNEREGERVVGSPTERTDRQTGIKGPGAHLPQSSFCL